MHYIPSADEEEEADTTRRRFLIGRSLFLESFEEDLDLDLDRERDFDLDSDLDRPLFFSPTVWQMEIINNY